MQHFHKILYTMGLKGEKTEGLKQALLLAHSYHADLDVLTLYSTLPTKLQVQQEAFETSLFQRMEDALKKASQSIPEGLPELTQEVSDTELPIAVALTRYVMRHECDLLIKEAEPNESKGFKALDMTLLRQCPSAVWLARPIISQKEQICVAVAIDPMNRDEKERDLSLRLLQTARAIADNCSGTLDIISYWEYPYEEYLRHSPWVNIPPEDINETVQSTQTEHREALDELIDASGIQGTHRIHHPRGEASELLALFVQNKSIDILVMGTIARTGIAGFFIGNTAENIFEKLTCSLLTLKPHGYVSPILAYD